MTLKEIITQASRVRNMGRSARSAMAVNSGPLEHRLARAYAWSGHVIVEAQKLRAMIKDYAAENGVELPK